MNLDELTQRVYKRKITIFSYWEGEKKLGGKDHATVLHACTTVQDLMSTDKAFRQYVADIESMVAVPVER